MKRRVVKKWIKRYIEPLTKDMPKTDRFSVEREIGNGMIAVYQTQHMIYNGFPKPEGGYPDRRAFWCTNLRKNIQRTAEQIQRIQEEYSPVYFRLCEVRGNKIRIRLITE